MMYNTQNYWVFRLCQSSGILSIYGPTFLLFDLGRFFNVGMTLERRSAYRKAATYTQNKRTQTSVP
jgi:hypothetical protein